MKKIEKSRLALIRILLYITMGISISISPYQTIKNSGFELPVVILWTVSLLVAVLVIEGSIHWLLKLLKKRGLLE